MNNHTKKDWALIKQGLIVLDRLGNFGRAPSELLYKFEQESKNEQTLLREQILKLEKALDNAIKQCCINASGSDACASLDELYKAFEKKVWEGVKENDSTRDV